MGIRFSPSLLTLTLFFVCIIGTATASLKSTRQFSRIRRTDDTYGPTYMLPTTNGPNQLPQPSGTLLNIGLGRGTNSYSCSSANDVVYTGSSVTLYDTVGLFPSLSTADGLQKLHELPGYLLGYGGYGSMPNVTLPTMGTEIVEAQPIKYIFTTNNLGSFATSDMETVPALNSGGDIDWTYLKFEPVAGSDSTVTEVYIVETAGGKVPSSCEGLANGLHDVDFAAEYWYYGS